MGVCDFGSSLKKITPHLAPGTFLSTSLGGMKLTMQMYSLFDGVPMFSVICFTAVVHCLQLCVCQPLSFSFSYSNLPEYTLRSSS